MEITWTPKKQKVSDLKLWDQNPRQIGKAEYERLKKRITERGFHDIIKVDTDNIILSGNQRRRALEELGVKEVWTMIPNRELTDEERNAVALESNRNDGEWDWDQMANFDLDFLKEMGFDDKELAKGLNLQLDVQEDEAPEPRPDPNVKLGDLFQLGKHRLLCGDATKKEDVERLMDGQKADMVFTDPPYGMNLDTDYSKLPGTSSKYEKVIGDDQDFDASVLFQMIDCPIWYLWGADYYCYSIPRYKEGSYIVWSKSQSENENKVIGSRFELCWTLPSQKKDVWFERSINQSSERTGEHPTQKPVALAARAINKSQPQKVVDLFGGSGSTLIACEQLNRKCYMMEIDPQYVRVIIDRWEKLTGKTAVKL